MNSDQYRRESQRHQQEIARLQQSKAQEVSRAAQEGKRASTAADAARRATSVSTTQSKIREMQRHETEAARHQQKVADLEGKIAREQGRLNEALRRLANADAAEAKRRAQAEQRTTQENRRALASIRGQLTEHAELHQVALSTLQKLAHPPEQITVLFLAANPIDQQQLRLDEEVRSIAEMIRKAEHRDAVRLESRWAVRPLDVLQAINECQPHVVHFSGHGSDRDEIVFQDAAGNAKLVSKEAIVQTMSAASDEIQLVFFNTCYSVGQAEAVVEHVPAAIGMNTSIGDEAARVFAAQFYSAIGFGLSIGLAFRQARAALLLEGIRQEDIPELFASAGLDVDSLVLVRPAPAQSLLAPSQSS